MPKSLTPLAALLAHFGTMLIIVDLCQNLCWGFAWGAGGILHSGGEESFSPAAGARAGQFS